ncbi:MAG: potassium channel family protein [Vulcanimicrobiaceae bacterium]
MFIIVVGGGKVGTYLASALLAQNHEVVVIEKEPRKVQYMSSILENDVALIGDGCDPLVLDQAGIERADVVVADTGDDEDNLVVCLITKKHSKARCIARVNNPKNKAIFASIDRERPITMISSTEIILDSINEHVNVRDYSIIAKLKDGDLELVRVQLPAGAPVDGKKISQIALPRGCIVVAIDRSGQEMIVPNGETMLHAGDEIILMAKQSTGGPIRTALVGAA